MDNVLARLERLEKQNSRLKLGLLTVTALFLCVCTIGAAGKLNKKEDGIKDVIKAKMFQVVNDDGKVVGSFYAGDGEGEGRPRIISGLVLSDGKDKDGKRSIIGMYSMISRGGRFGSVHVHARGSGETSEDKETGIDGGEITVEKVNGVRMAGKR